MKRQEITALRTQTPAELNSQLNSLQRRLNTAYLEKNARKLKNTSSIKNLKADIARVKTVLRHQSAQ